MGLSPPSIDQHREEKQLHRTGRGYIPFLWDQGKRSVLGEGKNSVMG